MNFINSYQRARILLLTGSVLCFIGFWWTAKAFHIPRYSGYDASLFLDGSVMMIVCVSVGTAVAGMVRFNAGLLTACLGLAALSFRGGEPRHTILWADSTIGESAIFLRFFGELLVLSVMIGAAWWILRNLYTKGKLKDRETAGMHEGENLDAMAEISSLGVQFLITLLGVMLIAQTEAKQQVMAAIFISSWGASAAAHTLFPTGPRSWYWLPPLMVGLLGYALAYVSHPDGVQVADVRGVFGGLFRPMPLDWASMGPAGAIVGHWMSRRWERERRASETVTA